MKKFLAFVAALAFSVAAFAQIPQTILQTAHATTLQIGEVSFADGIVMCSATAIGPHAILTASHCESPTDAISIRGYEDAKIHIDRIIRDDRDHSIFLLSGVTFEHYTALDLDYKPVQGEQVFIFGNPGSLSDIYRDGSVAGTTFNKDTDVLLVNLNGWHGDSGSGLFTASGKLIGVLAGQIAQSSDSDKNDQIAFVACDAVLFSPAELAEALAYQGQIEKPTIPNKRS